MEIKLDYNFEQIKKNTVKAEKQLKESDCVKFENPEGSGARILFVGNSITLHDALDEIGWYGNWGMAASKKEYDYVHRIISKISNTGKDAAYGITQVYLWEKGYKEGGEKLFHIYEESRKFEADIIVIRFIENCAQEDFDNAVFKEEFYKLLEFLNPNGNAKIIITTAFWHHKGDDVLREIANENAYPLIELGDLGELDEMKAIGLFTHDGVAAHPGDLGMQNIADRIYEKLKVYL